MSEASTMQDILPVVPISSSNMENSKKLKSTSSTSIDTITSKESLSNISLSDQFTCQDERRQSTSKNMNFDPAEQAPLIVYVGMYIHFFILTTLGHLRDFFGKIFKPQDYKYYKVQNGIAPLNSDFESFYTRRLYYRLRDCWNRPTTDVPSSTVTVLMRSSDDYNKTFKLTGESKSCINLSSYNYLGFAQSHGPCADDVEARIRSDGVGICSPLKEAGRMTIHRELEQLIAEFVGHEDAIICNMGFATNSCTIPALMGKGDLIISDELNHSSIVFGSRLSEATIRTFKHNDMDDLESVIRDSITQGKPRTHRPWKKILIIVEGLYSMEGSVCNLPKIVELKNKYKCYLFMDEAHSIGALGSRGRGVCDLLNVNPKDVDILMGTFTKSFGASGGYIAASKTIIRHLRQTTHSIIYSEPMAPLVCQQIVTALNIIMGRGRDPFDGIRRINAIRENSIFFHKALRKMGFIIWGECGSPIIPLLLFHPQKIAGFSREALKRGLACVVVGYPATAIYSSRVRFCISASHTREQLEEALAKISAIGDLLELKQSRYKSLFEAM